MRENETGENYIRASRRFINMIELDVEFITHDKSRQSLQKKYPEMVFIKSWRELSNILADNENILRDLLKKNYELRKQQGRLE